MQLTVLASREFSLGMLHGWRGILLGLVASAVFVVCGWQDSRPRFGFACCFWFLLALYSAGAVIWLGVGGRIWEGALAGTAVFCSEVWLIWRWLQVRGRQVENRKM